MGGEHDRHRPAQPGPGQEALIPPADPERAHAEQHRGRPGHRVRASPDDQPGDQRVAQPAREARSPAARTVDLASQASPSAKPRMDCRCGSRALPRTTPAAYTARNPEACPTDPVRTRARSARRRPAGTGRRPATRARRRPRARPARPRRRIAAPGHQLVADQGHLLPPGMARRLPRQQGDQQDDGASFIRTGFEDGHRPRATGAGAGGEDRGRVGDDSTRRKQATCQLTRGPAGPPGHHCDADQYAGRGQRDRRPEHGRNAVHRASARPPR